MSPNMISSLVSLHLCCRSSWCIVIVLMCFSTNLVTSFVGSRSRGEIYLNTSLTGLDRLIQNYRVICRLEDSCNDIPSKDYSFSRNPCCKPCSCETSCFSERTCCPEVLRSFCEVPKEEEIELECLKPAFRTPSKSIHRGIDNAFMIAECPHNF